MNWEGRITAEFRPFRASENRRSLRDIVAGFIEEQKQTWPLLQKGCEALKQVQTRRLELPGAEPCYVLAQFNPGRIRSTAAAVDNASIESRPCFLCVENLPPEEKGVAYGPDLVITCNPFPILENHLSIIARDHVPQSIDGRIESFLMLARDLGPEYFTLYNGPRCGASAPDHFHFQACSRSSLPIEEDLRFRAAADAPGPGQTQITLLENSLRSVVVFEGSDHGKLVGGIHRLITNLKLESGQSEEPLINIVALFETGLWRVYVFPRAKHRPSSFFAEGEERLLVSPGAIDMAGTIVMPDQKEFERVTAGQIATIFSEVSLDTATVNRALSSLH